MNNITEKLVELAENYKNSEKDIQKEIDKLDPTLAQIYNRTMEQKIKNIEDTVSNFTNIILND